MRVAVTGSRGQLGGAVVEEFARWHEVISFDRATLDVTDADAVAQAMAACRPTVIINCAAYNAVDDAEIHPVDALLVNASAVRSLARAARAAGATLVHYSSDFVFDGNGSRPLTEDDPPNPKSVYATSKLLGEWFAADAPRAYVLRVESLFGSASGTGPGKGSVAGIVEGLRAGAVPRVFVDRTVSPTFVLDAALATRELVEGQAVPGLYHCVNAGACTWFELATEAARLLQVEPRIEPVKVADLRLAAPRPQFSPLSIQKLEAAGITMPTWQDALARYLRQR